MFHSIMLLLDFWFKCSLGYSIDSYLNLFKKILLNLRLLNGSVYKATFIYFRKVSGNKMSYPSHLFLKHHGIKQEIPAVFAITMGSVSNFFSRDWGTNQMILNTQGEAK